MRILAVLLFATAGCFFTEFDEPDDRTPKELAKEAFELGNEAYRRGDYLSAVEHFEDAYDYVPIPLLQFNIGQAHVGAGQCEQARIAFALYTASLDGRPPPIDTNARLAKCGS